MVPDVRNTRLSLWKVSLLFSFLSVIAASEFQSDLYYWVSCLVQSFSLILPFNRVFDLNLTWDTELWVEVNKVTSVHTQIQVWSRQWTWALASSTVHCQWAAANFTALLMIWCCVKCSCIICISLICMQRPKRIKDPWRKAVFQRGNMKNTFVSPGDFVKSQCFLRLSYNTTEASVGQIMPLSTSARYVKLG